MDKKEQQLNKLLKENASLPAPDADKILLAARVKMAEKEKTRKPVSKYSKIWVRIAAIGAACLVFVVTLVIVFNQIGFGGGKNQHPDMTMPETAYSYYQAHTLTVSKTTHDKLQSNNLQIATLTDYLSEDIYLYTFSASGEAAMAEAKYRIRDKNGSISEVVVVTDFAANRAHERYKGLNVLDSITFKDYSLNAISSYKDGEYTARIAYLASDKTYILDIKNPLDFNYNNYLELFFKNL